MERKKKKAITLDGLAGLMEKGFKKQEKRTDGLVKTMNQFAVSVDKRFGNIDMRFGNIDRRFDSMDRRFDKIDRRFDKIETDICDIKEEIHKMRIEMRGVWSKLEELEQKMEKVSGMSKEDTDALANDVFKLKRRVGFLENKVKKLQVA